MTDLMVETMHVRARAGGPDDGARLRGLVDDLTGRRLEEALATLTLPEGHWCVRRLDVRLAYRADDADAVIGRSWARAVVDALAARTGTDGSDDVAHYVRPAQAVTELVSELALGRSGRRWAWRTVGVLGDSDPDPGTAPTATVLAVLDRHPAATLPALVGAVRRCGLAAVHRLLGEAGWVRLTDQVLRVRGVRADHARAALRPAATGTPPRIPAAAVAAVADAILSRSLLLASSRIDRVRPTATCARAWAALATAEAEPVALRRPDLDVLVDAVAGAVERRSPTRSAPTTLPAPTVGSRHTAQEAPADAWHPGGREPLSTRSSPAPDVATDHPERRTPPPDDAPPDAATTPGDAERDLLEGRDRPDRTADGEPPDRLGPAPTAGGPPTGKPTTDPAGQAVGQAAGDDGPTRPPISAGGTEGVAAHQVPPRAEPAEDPVGHPTSWGGLVYLLATAAGAGVPDAVIAEAGLQDRPPSWVVFHLTRLLIEGPGAAEDPMPRVLAGLAPHTPAPQPPPPPQELRLLERHADRWAAVTARRLDHEATGSPRDLVRRLAARTGTVEWAPGWTEVRLDLADVDLAVRRAGLDIDPGFVPWLGTVVVIRYV